MAEWVTVCKLADLRQGDGKTVSAKGLLLALFRTGDTVSAIDDACPHMGASLAGGCFEDGVVTCPWHAWRFRASDGTWVDNPRIKTGSYAARVEDGMVQVEIPEGKGRKT